MMIKELNRLEDKVDTLTEAITQLVLFEERQSVQSTSLAALTLRMNTTEQKLDMWINRGMGVWALAAVLFATYKTTLGG